MRSWLPHADDDRVFLRGADGSEWTYRDTLALSARMAAVLTGLGAEAGDRVVVQVDKSPEALALYFACVHAGLVLVPLNPAYTTAEVGYFVDDAEPGGRGRRHDAGARSRSDRPPPRGRAPHVVGRRFGQPHRGRSAGRPCDGERRCAGTPATRATWPPSSTPRARPRPLQGGDAEPRQPPQQHSIVGRGVAFHEARRAAARTADLPHPRVVRGRQRDARPLEGR